MVNIGKYTIFRYLLHICNLIVQISVHSYMLGLQVYYGKCSKISNTILSLLK